MACNRSNLIDYLSGFTGQDPINAIICPFAQSSGGGAGMGLPVFAMFVVGFLGLGLSIRAQHPGPVLVAGMLSMGLFATALPGIVLKVAALVFFFGIAAMGMYLYQRARTSL